MTPPRSSKPRGNTVRRRSDVTSVTVFLPPDLVRFLDLWISSQPYPRLDRPRAIRLALREWLMTRELRRHLGQVGDEGSTMELSGP